MNCNSSEVKKRLYSVCVVAVGGGWEGQVSSNITVFYLPVNVHLAEYRKGKQSRDQ